MVQYNYPESADCLVIFSYSSITWQCSTLRYFHLEFFLKNSMSGGSSFQENHLLKKIDKRLENVSVTSE